MSSCPQASSARTLYSIGHSNHPLDRFVGLLRKAGITAVVDVRSHPVSRFFPHFNKKSLKRELERHGIQYLFLGRELGARPQDPQVYVDGVLSFELICQTSYFMEGIEQLLEAVARYRVAMMCAEKEPLGCHRTLLVARFLKQREDLEIIHILADGTLEAHPRTEARLLKLLKLQSPLQKELFDQDPEKPLLERSYRLQWEKIFSPRKRQKK